MRESPREGEQGLTLWNGVTHPGHSWGVPRAALAVAGAVSLPGHRRQWHIGVKRAFLAVMFPLSAFLSPFVQTQEDQGPIEDIPQGTGTHQDVERTWSSLFDPFLAVPFRLELGITVWG